MWSSLKWLPSTPVIAALKGSKGTCQDPAHLTRLYRKSSGLSYAQTGKTVFQENVSKKESGVTKEGRDEEMNKKQASLHIII